MQGAVHWYADIVSAMVCGGRCCFAGMASATVKDRLNRLGQGVLQPSAGLAALAAVLRSAAGLMALAGTAGAAVVTVNPFKWGTYLQHMQVHSRQMLVSCVTVDQSVVLLFHLLPHHSML
jgi:hypothetical protein